MTKFNSGDSLGALPSADIAKYLTDVGDLDGARPFMPGVVQGQTIPFTKPPYKHLGFILGFIPPGATDKSSDIMAVSQVTRDTDLISKRIKISLDKFHVDNYPGLGAHNILCEFSGSNQVAEVTEPLQFALRFKCNDKASASQSGVPLFLGVTVGKDGISFEGRTINVSSDLDEALLSTLDSPSFQNGLSLLRTAQPALKPFSTLAEAAVKNVLKRSKNKQIHNFNLGLDFGFSVTSARLRLGSYVVIQSDDAVAWDWSAFEWNRDAMALQYRDRTKSIDFNYMIFGITQFDGDAP